MAEARERERRAPVNGFPPDAGATARLGAEAPEKPSYPDPFTDPEPSRELEHQILEISTHMELAGHRRLQLLAEFDARRGWELGGHASCAHWLAARAKLSRGTAREMVRVARALEDLPETSAWMAMGRISFCQARALTRVATADNEAELLQASDGMTTAQVERLVRGWRLKSAADAVEREQERQRSRSFSVVPDLDGMYIVRGRLTPEHGALLMRAIEAAGDVLFREETPGQPYESKVAMPEGARLGADAATGSADARAVGDTGVSQPATPFPLSGSRAGRYQVMLHVEMDALHEDDPTCGAGCSHLDDGVRVSHETSRRLSCDAAVVPLFLDADGRVADAGHSRRVVSPALRRALESRDRGCRFPGCGLPYTEAHHIRHWADGGETSLENCALLCRHHHGLLHEGGWKMEILPGRRLVFRDPHGGSHYDGRFELPRLDFERRHFPVRELMRENLRRSRENPGARRE